MAADDTLHITERIGSRNESTRAAHHIASPDLRPTALAIHIHHDGGGQVFSRLAPHSEGCGRARHRSDGAIDAGARACLDVIESHYLLAGCKRREGLCGKPCGLQLGKGGRKRIGKAGNRWRGVLQRVEIRQAVPLRGRSRRPKVRARGRSQPILRSLHGVVECIYRQKA